ncbi:MAG TPA: hypothetical protein PL048_15290 [Leptospiraceae bacterium]|nr:hypothetical protein [Leptospiraceae bacterium]HMY66003.1 hypothetical protein [Leptospiraceae bacterium]HMZ60139.1 hypothetical protein [Leptospiraceae bacterium]HNF13151.1 hypothetical protein [Leptospiraceae bacterium]HNF24387.1 hypothetical protein [Leptospiraceae bacterium]
MIFYLIISLFIFSASNLGAETDLQSTLNLSAKDPEKAGEQGLERLKKFHQETGDRSVRKKICQTLSGFKNSSISEKAYSAAESIVQYEKESDVNLVCVNSLLHLSSDRNKSCRILVHELKKLAGKKDIQNEDEILLQRIIEVIGQQKFKGAYVSLMKILESGYSVQSKNSAKKVIESLPI